MKQFILAVIRMILGNEFYVYHIDKQTGKKKVFPCNTYRDALEWMVCCHQDDICKIVSREGYLIESRY